MTRWDLNIHRSPVPSLITLAVITVILFLHPTAAWRPWPHLKPNTTNLEFGPLKKYEGSSEFVKLRYHMGPVLTSDITVHIIWYGTWLRTEKKIILDFINSISSTTSQSPSVSGWWKTLQLYTDQTGSNISRTVQVGEQKNDRLMSYEKTLTRLSVQSVIKSAISAKTKPLPITPKSGIYLFLTSQDVYVQDFCQNVCGFHYFTFPSIVGYTLPYAWIGNSFAIPDYIPGLKPVKSPNGDVAIDGMISVIAHELAEIASDPFVNAWYAGQDPVFPVEIADLCEGIYGTGGGGSYTGQMMNDGDGATYNMHGIKPWF